MPVIAFFLLTISVGLANAQPLKSVSNADIDPKKHQQLLASRLLSWSTGNKEQINYVSVGRYANYFGFVKMRVSSAHSLKRSEVGKETLSVLTESQQQMLFQLLEGQKPLIGSTHLARLQANDFLNEVLIGTRSVAERDRFLEQARQYSVREAELGIFLATGFAEIIDSLTDQQENQLSQVRAKHTSGVASKVKFNSSSLRALTKADKQEAFNLAARLVSWTTGSVDDFAFETIGKPSQHFGFVSMRIESNHGVKRGVIADEVVGLLTAAQRAQLLSAATADSRNLQSYLVARETFVERLSALREKSAHTVDVFNGLAADMATLEANMSWYQAVAMKRILDTLSQNQLDEFTKLRHKYSPTKNVSAENLFQQCAACHQNSQIAPDLSAIVGRKVAGTDFSYSPAIRKYAEQNSAWNKALLMEFLRDPQHTIPGTTMSYKGISDDMLLGSLVEYLSSL